VKIYKLLFISVFLSIFAACSDDTNYDNSKVSENYSPDETNTVYNQEKISEEDFYDDDDGSMPNDQYDNITTTGTNIPITDEELKKIGKKIIKNADISLVFSDYEKDIKALKDTLKKYNCEITNETESNYENYISNTIVLRVEATKFDSVMNAILSGDGTVTSKNIYVSDITSQYIDTYQRLKNKKSVEKQYLELLKKAYTVNDVLNVTEYLRRVQEEIESAEGTLKYWDNQSTFSTITINISYSGETIAYKKTFWNKISEGLDAGWQGAIAVIIVIFYLWPIWILTGIIIFVVKRKLKKKLSRVKKNK